MFVTRQETEESKDGVLMAKPEPTKQELRAMLVNLIATTMEVKPQNTPDFMNYIQNRCNMITMRLGFTGRYVKRAGDGFKWEESDG